MYFIFELFDGELRLDLDIFSHEKMYNKFIIIINSV